jgi:hypothetical protein
MDPSLLEGDALSGSGGDPARVRRSIALGHLDLEGRPVPVRLQRVRPAGGDPRWVFSAQTVENIPALYRLHGPGWIETVVPERWRGPLIGTRAGDWLVLGVVTAVLGLAAWLLLRLGAGLARHRAGTPLGTLIGRTRRPLAPLLALWLLREMYQALFTLNGVLPLGNLLVSRVASIGAFVLARGFLSRGGSAGCLHDL